MGRFSIQTYAMFTFFLIAINLWTEWLPETGRKNCLLPALGN